MANIYENKDHLSVGGPGGQLLISVKYRINIIKLFGFLLH